MFGLSPKTQQSVILPDMPLHETDRMKRQSLRRNMNIINDADIDHLSPQERNLLMQMEYDSCEFARLIQLREEKGGRV